MIAIMYVTKSAQHALTCANACFFWFCIANHVKFGRTRHPRTKRCIRVHMGKRGRFLMKLYRICVQIRCALHKVTTQERPGGGERGGVSYILIRFIRCDSESTRLRTKGPGGLLTTNYELLTTNY